MRITLALLFSILCSPSFAQGPAQSDSVRFAGIFGDHMVLQQAKRVPVFGFGPPQSPLKIKASFMTQAVETVIGDDGRWQVSVDTPPASGPHSLTLTSKETTITLTDIQCGEVWLCSGQSNMEMPVGYKSRGYSGVLNWEKEIERASYPRIRLCTVENRISRTATTDCTLSGPWQPASKERVKDFSATAWFFAKALQKELGVPVGLVAADWGGTPAQAWMSAEALTPFPHYEKLATQWSVKNKKEQGQSERELRAQLRQWFEQLDPKDAAWRLSDFDDQSWGTVSVPGVWANPELEAFDGHVRLRKTIELPDQLSNQELILNLGAVDDRDTVWWNGHRIGGLTGNMSWNIPRRYIVPGQWVKAGPNTIAVSVIDTGGAMGITAQGDSPTLRPGGETTQKPIALAGEWRFERGQSMRDLPRLPAEPRFSAQSPSGLWNGMIAPLVPFAFRGALWYQGESNCGRAKEYAPLFRQLINSWRETFDPEGFPFYFVQIAPYAYRGNNDGPPELRESQLSATTLPRTGMVVTTDIGNLRDIHPKNKQAVGQRLAQWALHGTYGLADKIKQPSGPLYLGMAKDGATIRCHFRFHKGLSAAGGAKSPLKGFTVAGEDGVFHPAKARVVGNEVVVSSPKVPAPYAVRYAWSAAAEGNLSNASGLPASPFRSDDGSSLSLKEPK